MNNDMRSISSHAKTMRGAGLQIPRSSGYVIPMSVMADMLSANNEKKEILYIMC